MTTLKNHLTDYTDLIIRFLNGSASIREIETLREWVRKEEDNKNEFLRMRLAWMALAQHEQLSVESLNDALIRLNRKIELANKKSKKHSSGHFNRIIKIAAGFLLVFLLGSLSTFLLIKNDISGSHADMDDNFMYIYAPKGSKAKTILQDGTTVWLNAGSNLMYSTGSYGKADRQVTLIGEGFFQVAENADIPFIVNAKDLQITALGTEFNVKAYPDEDLVETTLVEGLVKITGEKQNREKFTITLKPNQHVILPTGKSVIDNVALTDPDKIEVEKLSDIQIMKVPTDLVYKPSISTIKETEIYTSWKDEKWVLIGEEVGNLAILLERRYNINIRFGSEELKNYRFTGTFQNETVEQVMQVLKLTAPMEYVIRKGEIIMNLDPALKKKYEKYLNHN